MRRPVIHGITESRRNHKRVRLVPHRRHPIPAARTVGIDHIDRDHFGFGPKATGQGQNNPTEPRPLRVHQNNRPLRVRKQGKEHLRDEPKRLAVSGLRDAKKVPVQVFARKLDSAVGQRRKYGAVILRLDKGGCADMETLLQAEMRPCGKVALAAKPRVAPGGGFVARWPLWKLTGLIERDLWSLPFVTRHLEPPWLKHSPKVKQPGGHGRRKRRRPPCPPHSGPQALSPAWPPSPLSWPPASLPACPSSGAASP